MGQIWVCLNLIHNLGKYEKENMGQIWVALSQIGLAGGGVQSTQINNSTLLCITTFTGKQAFSMGTYVHG